MYISENLDLVHFGNIDVKGSLKTGRGTSIKADGHIEAGGYIEAGWFIEAGWSIEADEYIEAGGYIEVGRSIKAGRYIEAKLSVVTFTGEIKTKTLTCLRVAAGLKTEEPQKIIAEDIRGTVLLGVPEKPAK